MDTRYKGFQLVTLTHEKHHVSYVNVDVGSREYTPACDYAYDLYAAGAHAPSDALHQVQRKQHMYQIHALDADVLARCFESNLSSSRERSAGRSICCRRYTMRFANFINCALVAAGVDPRPAPEGIRGAQGADAVPADTLEQTLAERAPLSQRSVRAPAFPYALCQNCLLAPA